MKKRPQICKIPGTEDNDMVHFVLSHSYFIYLAAIVFGILLDLRFPVRFLSPLCTYEGVILMFFGSFLIYWAQTTSRGTKKQAVNGNPERDFERGPYRFSRNPTHTGLGMMTLGFALLMGSFFMAILAVVAYTVSKLYFLPREEDLLLAKYGPLYCQYQAKVRTWL